MLIDLIHFRQEANIFNGWLLFTKCKTEFDYSFIIFFEKRDWNANNIVGGGRFRPQPGVMAATPAYHGSSSSTFLHQPSRQYTFPYSAYG